MWQRTDERERGGGGDWWLTQWLIGRTAWPVSATLNIICIHSPQSQSALQLYEDMDNCAECVTHTHTQIYNIYSNGCKILANHKAIASNDSSNCANNKSISQGKENFFFRHLRSYSFTFTSLAIHFSITFIPAVATFALLWIRFLSSLRQVQPGKWKEKRFPFGPQKYTKQESTG